MTERVGPFGLHMGQPGTDFELEVHPDGACQYKIGSVPHPHPLFLTYYGRFVNGFGLSRIFADSEAINTDCEGLKPRGEFFDMRSRLAKKYGEPELLSFRTDFDVDPDGLPVDPPEEPAEWMQELYDFKRVFCASWNDMSGYFDGTVASMGLLACAESPETGFLRIDYTLSNDDEALSFYQEKIDQENSEVDWML